jgi:hypothetical protein
MVKPNSSIDLGSLYPLRLGRYLTESERREIRELVPDTRVDWSHMEDISTIIDAPKV